MVIVKVTVKAEVTGAPQVADPSRPLEQHIFSLSLYMFFLHVCTSEFENRKVCVCVVFNHGMDSS